MGSDSHNTFFVCRTAHIRQTPLCNPVGFLDDKKGNVIITIKSSGDSTLDDVNKRLYFQVGYTHSPDGSRKALS